MEQKHNWCGLVAKEDVIEVCFLCETKDRQVRVFQNTPEQHKVLLDWLLSEACSHIALNPVHGSWKQIHSLLKKRFDVKVIQGQLVSGTASEARGPCCQWLAELLKDGRLERTDQVEPIGDRTPHSDEDALGGQRGKGPEHSGQERK
jgi:transposase